MTDKESNMRLWDKHADIDPKYTKSITGKSYKGTSPNPQHVIQCLTDLFGPVGIGFGWDVVAEEWQPIGAETIHWCRIKFWHTDRANTFDSYGQTRAAYTTHSGKAMVDEDAPKKSLTDAIIKASSHIGIAANIFLGRWDDQKYVNDLKAEYGEGDSPKFDSAAALGRIKDAVSKSITANHLTGLWASEKAALEALEDEHFVSAKAAFSKRKAELTQRDPAPHDNADLGGDEIPYEGKAA